MFVADLTIVAARDVGIGGLINSNVGIEWGWASAALGDSGLIGVINEAYGDPGQLPVDIRQQLVSVRYRLRGDDSDEVRAEVATALAKRLEDAVVGSVKARFFRAMHEAAPKVVLSIMEEAGDAAGDFEYDVPEAATRANVTEEAAEAVLHDLLLVGLGEEAGYAGSGTRVRVGSPFFAYFDPLYKGWNADRDARDLARILMEREWLKVAELATELRWSARRMNPALFRIEQWNFARVSLAHESVPFAVQHLYRNEATRAFAEGRAELGPIAPRAPQQLG